MFWLFDLLFSLALIIINYEMEEKNTENKWFRVLWHMKLLIFDNSSRRSEFNNNTMNHTIISIRSFLRMIFICVEVAAVCVSLFPEDNLNDNITV